MTFAWEPEEKGDMVRFECGCSSNEIMVDGILSIPAFVAWRQEKSRMPEHIDAVC